MPVLGIFLAVAVGGAFVSFAAEFTLGAFIFRNHRRWRVLFQAASVQGFTDAVLTELNRLQDQTNWFMYADRMALWCRRAALVTVGCVFLAAAVPSVF